MKILYIDTSSNYLYSGISNDDKLISYVKEDYGHQLSEMALYKIVEMLEKSHITPNEINKIIVVNGPGSFTGIRIGITIAKIISWSLKIPIITISALEAMKISTEQKGYICPVINARREYVFGAIYNENGEEVLEPKHIKIDAFKDKLKNCKEYKIVTNDKELEEYFENPISYNPDILKIIMTKQNDENINPHMVNPEYLKLTEAEEKNDN